MSGDEEVLPDLLPWARERAQADRVALLKAAVGALKAALPVWAAARADDDRVRKAHRAAEVWCKNPQAEFAEACAGAAMEAASAAEEADEGPASSTARAAQRLGEAVLAADAEDVDEVAELVARAVGDLARALEPAALRAAIPGLPGGEAAPRRASRMDQTERAAPSDGEAHKLLFALREAERWLVPEHLDLPDHALLLSPEEREEALRAVRAGEAPPQDLRALVAGRRKETTQDAPRPAPSRKTIGDEGAPAPLAEPAPEEAPPEDALVEAATSEAELPAGDSDATGPSDREPLPLERRAPPLPDPSTGVRLIGLLCLLLFGAAAWKLHAAAFGPQLVEAIENARLRLLLQVAAVALPGYPALLGLLALLSGRQPSGRWLPLDPNPLGLPFEPWWWSTLWTMAAREVQSTMARPIAYMGMFLFLVTNGYLFIVLLNYYGDEMSLGRDLELPASYWLTQNWVLWLSLIIICPAITMRLLAEEAQMGTLEGLLTTPVTHPQVVLSKFAGALAFFAVMLLLSGGYVGIVAGFSPEWDWGPVLGGYLGLLLAGGLFLSMGLFTSAWSNSQVVAFVLSVALCLSVWIAPQFLGGQFDNEALRAVLKYVNLSQQQEELAKGILHWRTLVFYGSSMTFFLFMSVRGVESHTWR